MALSARTHFSGDGSWPQTEGEHIGTAPPTPRRRGTDRVPSPRTPPAKGGSPPPRPPKDPSLSPSSVPPPGPGRVPGTALTLGRAASPEGRAPPQPPQRRVTHSSPSLPARSQVAVATLRAFLNYFLTISRPGLAGGATSRQAMGNYEFKCFSLPPCFSFGKKQAKQTQTNPNQMWPVRCKGTAPLLRENLTSGRGDKQGWARKMGAGVPRGREEG